MKTQLSLRERRLEFAIDAISNHFAGDRDGAAEAVAFLRRIEQEEANRDLIRRFSAPVALRELVATQLDEAVALLLQIYPEPGP